MASLNALKRVPDDDPDPGSTQSKRIKFPAEEISHPIEPESPIVAEAGEASGAISTKSIAASNELNRSDTSEGLDHSGDIKMADEKGETPEKANVNHSKRRDVKLGKGKEKEEKKSGRRGRRGTRNDEATEGEPRSVQDGPKAPRLPKRQCALLIGFCGSGYSGMQMCVLYICLANLPYLTVINFNHPSQPDHSRTIEGVLFQAMVRAGAVSQDNADNPVKVALLFQQILHEFTYFLDRSCSRRSYGYWCPCCGKFSVTKDDHDRAGCS